MTADAALLGAAAATLASAPPATADAPRAGAPTIPGTTKPRTREVRGLRFDRFPIKSPLIVAGDDLVEIVRTRIADLAQPGDVLVVSESVVAIAQGRALRKRDIRVGLPARVLWRFVRKVPYGIGLRSPQTMQCAIDECGLARIVVASAAGAIGKLFGRRGDFYRVAGMQAATIDAASTSPIPEYNDSVILGPKDPEGEAAVMAHALGMSVAIVDVNDIGGSWVLGASSGVNRSLLEDILRDNPLGQGAEMTPFGLVRPVH